MNVVLAGGMGGLAQELLRQSGIEVHLGIAEADRRELVAVPPEPVADGDNLCNHGDGDDHHQCRH